MECRGDLPEEVNKAHGNYQRGHGQELFSVALETSREQQEKGEGEMQEDKQQTNPSPPPLLPSNIPGNFLGQIAGEHDQELRKSQVGPEHHKSQQQLAQVMEMFG